MMRPFLGVGNPAALSAARVACLLRAESTAAGRWPGSPNDSQSRDTSGTESSTKVAMPSAGPVRPSSPNCRMRRNASVKISSELCDMSTGRNLAMRPSPTRLALQESGCSMTTVFMPSWAARSKVKRFPGRPAEMKTMVAPLESFLRKSCVSVVAVESRPGGILASSWYVAVGARERMASSRCCVDIGLGKFPGDAKSCSTSNFERRRSLLQMKLLGLSVSTCTETL
mmetsp:Transcript_52580/g.122348  ORF Transcript_52580/g.122348 Transcript_52580/m.122348 type:complete len:227 (+) Transcript_52580:1144-1824(+)